MDKFNPLAADLDHILAHTQGLWEPLRGQKIFLTGGTGFFGCWLLESFARVNEELRLNASVLVLTRDPDTFKARAPHIASNPAIRFHVGDIRAFDFPEGKFPFIIHAATEASAKLNEEEPLRMFETVVEGTSRVLEFARVCSASRLLLTSSGLIHGAQPPGLSHVPEDFAGGPPPAEPRFAYHEGKRAAEMLCATHARQHGLSALIARGWAFVGPYLPLDIHFAIGNFIRDGLKGGPIVIKGDGSPFRSYMYTSDLAIWLWTILFKGQTCRPYNVGSEADLSIADVAKAVAQAFQKTVEVQVVGKPAPNQPRSAYVPCTRRAREELGLRETIPLRHAVERTIEWHLRRNKC